MTKDKWDQLPPKAQWDIIVALRGPDCHHAETIKWFSTSVIRGVMSGTGMRVGGLINDDLKAVVIPQGFSGIISSEGKKVGAEAVRWFWNSSHFFTHIIEAAQWINLPVIMVPTKVYVEAIDSHRHKAVAKFISALEDGTPEYFYQEAATKEWIKELKRHSSSMGVGGGY